MSEMQLKMWQQTELGRAVHAYTKSGLSVFPCHSIHTDGGCTCSLVNCTRAGKHPFCKNGLSDATKNFDEAAELFKYRKDLNVGILCGKASDILIIDIDTHKGGEESLKKLEERLGILPECPVVITGGGGRHLVFEYPQEPVKSRSNFFGDEYPGVDIKNDGGYVVWPPSMHKSGKRYMFAPGALEIDNPTLPLMWLGEMKTKPKEKSEVDRTIYREFVGNKNEHREWKDEEIVDMLSFLNADCSYPDWYEIGMAVHDGGYAFSIFDDWSSTGRTKYKGTHNVMGHWKSFGSGKGITIGTLVSKAKVMGWKIRAEERPEKDISNVLPLVNKIIEKSKKSAPEVVTVTEKPLIARPAKYLDFDASTIPGMIGDTVRWILKHSIFEQPELALLNTLAMAGAVFGRKYASPKNTRTNIYTVGVARTGSGKENSVRVLETLALDANLAGHIGSNSVRSDIGVLKGLMASSSQLMMIDEFGMLMQALSDPRASYHHKSIISLFTKIYSKSSGTYNHGEIGDDRQKKIIISAPNLCLYGTTTESSYIPALKRSTIESGELNRFIVIPSFVTPPPKHDDPDLEPNPDLVALWARFAPKLGDSLGSIVNSATVAPKPQIVQWGECKSIKEQILEEQVARTNEDTPYSALWGRLFENSIKIAMIFAIARDPEGLEFVKEDFDYAREIVGKSIKYMSVLAESSMSENQREGNHHELYKFIKSHPDGVSRTAILRKFRKFNKKEQEDLLSSMLDEEIIIAVKKADPNRPGPAAILYQAVA